MTDPNWGGEEGPPDQLTLIPTHQSHQSVADRFRPTIVARARKRTVSPLSPDRHSTRRWDVAGDPKLGDAYESYLVQLKVGERTYHCSCYTTKRGDVRQRSVCSHIIAVLLFREGGGDGIAAEGPSNALGDTERGGSGLGDTTVGQEALWGSSGPGQSGQEGDHREHLQPAEELASGRGAEPTGGGEHGDRGRDHDGIEPRGTGEVGDSQFPAWYVNPILRDNPQLSSMPEWAGEWRKHQREAVEVCIDQFQQGKRFMFLQAPVGCLAGDSEIIINRGGNATRKRMDHLVSALNGGLVGAGSGSHKLWNLSIPTQTRSVSEDGTLRLTTILKAIDSGRQLTFEVTSETGRKLRATANHPFLTPDGWKPLSQLAAGDTVVVESVQKKKVTRSGSSKNYYKQVGGLLEHPYASQRNNARGDGWTVPEHRLVVEAALNGLKLDEFVLELRHGTVGGFTFLDPKIWSIHHVNGNHQDNRSENLQIVTPTEHHSEHHDHSAHVLYGTTTERIEQIREYGVEPTYDLMLDEPHNFLANGFVVHNSGKSMIAESIRRMLGTNALYLVNTIQLEEQLADPIRGFPYAQTIHGREHFPTLNFPQNFTPPDRWTEQISCGDCDKDKEGNCTFCTPSTSCPYSRAKFAAISAELTVANYAYGIAEMNSAGGLANRGLVICDEVDELESILLSTVETTITPRRQRQLGISKPTIKTHRAQGAQTSWEEWVMDDALPNVGNELKKVRARISYLQSSGAVEGLIPLYREKKYLERLKGRLDILAQEIPEGGWVQDYDSRDYENSPITFKPIRVHRFGNEYLWRHARRFLLMSATIIAPDQMAADLGIDEAGEYGWHDVPSVFPVANRPIRVVPIANMTYKEMEFERPYMAAATRVILERFHPTDRVLVHSVSYDNTRFLADELSRNGMTDRIVSYSGSGGRVDALEQFKRTPASVLIAPSFTRGADLPDDLCRGMIFTKVPYPSLADKQVDARLNEEGHRLEGQQWFNIQTVRPLAQGSGRGVRHEEDTATTWILDKQFSKLHRMNQQLFPKWFREALVWHGPWRREIEAVVGR